VNCKPGDLARYVGVDPACYGWVVLVVVESHVLDNMVMWETSPPLPMNDGSGEFANGTADCALRPIRPDEGEDETLTWAGKPEKVPA
jgi:hypothetical protein